MTWLDVKRLVESGNVLADDKVRFLDIQFYEKPKASVWRVQYDALQEPQEGECST